jgi:hypothetical protein
MYFGPLTTTPSATFIFLFSSFISRLAQTAWTTACASRWTYLCTFREGKGLFSLFTPEEIPHIRTRMHLFPQASKVGCYSGGGERGRGGQDGGRMRVR